MLYDYLAEFAAVVREGSLTKAAAALSVSQASLSRHMRALEAELNTKLFDRGLDGIHLTEGGYGVYPLAAEIFDLGASAVEQCREGGRTAVLSVYGLDDYPAYMRILQEALPRWPGADVPSTVRFLPHPSTRQELAAALAEHPRSLYFTLATDASLAQPDTSREVVELFHPQVVAVMDPSNPLASKDALTAADLQGQLVLRSDNNLRARIVCDDSHPGHPAAHRRVLPLQVDLVEQQHRLL